MQQQVVESRSVRKPSLEVFKTRLGMHRVNCQPTAGQSARIGRRSVLPEAASDYHGYGDAAAASLGASAPLCMCQVWMSWQRPNRGYVAETMSSTFTTATY